MTSRHTRGSRRSRPRLNTPPRDVVNVDITAIDRALVERTGIYDPILDGTVMDAAAIDAALIEVADSLIAEASEADAAGLAESVIVEGPAHWVRVTCPACGVVRVRADRVVVRNCIDDEAWSYRARCSECDTTFLAQTPAALALPAVAAGLAVETWSLPVPSARRSGSPLHAVDVLELHLAMLETDWFDQLARVEPLGDR